MKPLHLSSIIFVITSILFMSCHSNEEHKSSDNKSPKIKTDTVTYTIDSFTMKSFVMYDENKEGKRPGVMVVHEWWGLNDYVKSRAHQLAEMGYIAMAVDMYGNGRMGNDPEEAGKLATPYYQDAQMAKRYFDAGLEKLRGFAQTDSSKLAGIGYCFGGGILLNLARLGEPLNGVVSFHGSLIGTPANKDLLRSQVLVCHGGDDKFVPESEVEQFKKQMDSISAKYTFKTYPGATHAFTNPGATDMGKKFNIPIAYNAAADTASWNEMKQFFGKLFQ